MSFSLEVLYLNTSYFVDAIGWIEMGRDDDSPLTSFIRALDVDGMVWEGKDDCDSLDEAFQDVERAITEWMQAEGIEPE